MSDDDLLETVGYSDLKDLPYAVAYPVDSDYNAKLLELAAAKNWPLYKDYMATIYGILRNAHAANDTRPAIKTLWFIYYDQWTSNNVSVQPLSWSVGIFPTPAAGA